ncbi:MAG: PDDEXK nuclease domain-containing protein [Planctomycetaceae bacterium]|jgi:predicted nuclease of restriction endonuclease-like (RecB) superfamily|nr:PDDEXK nuclease domain-containing protein [Planctomycetaceae bacterium]
MKSKQDLTTITLKDKQYREWLNDLKQKIRQSQIKAAVRVNSALIELYWNLGVEIVAKQAESVWGSGIIKQLSTDLRAEFPNIQGFSETNLWYIKKFYLFYNQQNIKLRQLGAELHSEKLQQLVGEIPWGHHIVIITKCKSVDEAIFYLQKTVQEGWSRAVLVHHLEANLYKTQGKAITNFQNTLSDVQCDLAKEILKEPYCFDFLTLTAGYKEKELEDALTQNIVKFLLELGKGFAFVGRQVEVNVGNSSFFVDMLFYHIRLKCFVVVELKTVNFEPEFAGKLNFYVTAVDRQMRGEDDNATIGLLICKTKDDVIVEYSLSDIHKPVGVSSYELSKIIPLEFQSSLPSIEEIEAELENIKQK